ncbi:MAG: hypothetical protein AAGE43_07205 [Pseudomonadota bacterium]
MRLIYLTVSLTAASLTALMPTTASAESDCAEIVAATVAEIRAGAETWDAATEAQIRAAAGSACVKADSERYSSAAEQAAGPELPAEEEATEAAPAVLEEEPIAVADGDLVADAEEATKDDGKAGWKFLGFEVNSVTGSPGQKHYQRKRP